MWKKDSVQGNMGSDIQKTMKWEYPGWVLFIWRVWDWVIQINLNLALKARMFLGDSWSRKNNADEAMTAEAVYEPIAERVRGKQVETTLCGWFFHIMKLCKWYLVGEDHT